MTAKNDITGDSIKSKAANDKYRSSPFWEALEKKKKAEKAKKEPSSSTPT